MVQIIDPSPVESRASLLGKAMAQGMAKNFAPPEQLVQRGMLQDALQKVRGLAESGASPMDIALGMMEAGAGIPGSERYLSQLLPMILQGQAAKTAYGDQQATPQAGQQAPMPMTQEPQQNMAAPLLKQMGIPIQEGQQPQGVEPGTAIQLGDYVPVDVGAYIDPNEAKNIISNTAKAGGDINLTKKLINDYNEGLIDYNQLLNSNVDRKTAQISRQLELESRAKSFMDEQLPANTPESRKNLYYEMFKRNLANSKDMTSAWQNTTKDIQYTEDQFENIPNLIPDATSNIGIVPLGIPDTAESMIRNSVANIMEKDPLAYPILEEMFVQKGWPVTQAAKVLNPLDPTISRVTEKVTDYRPEIYPKTPMSEQAMIRNLDMIQKEQIGQVPDLVKKLKGRVNDRTSFINIYTDFRSKGWLAPAIDEFFNQLEKSGVKFSEQQQAERVKINNNPQIPIKYL